MEEAVFIEERRKSIGGTDISAICGINGYRNASDVFCEKVLGHKTEENEAMIAGKLFEEALAKRFNKATGLVPIKPPEMLTIKKKGYFHASIDYYCEDYDGEPAVIECKTTNASFNDKKEFFELFPQYYMQVQWYMWIYGYKKAYFSVYQFGFATTYHWFKVEFNEKYVKEAARLGTEFWENHILTQNPPPPQSSKDYDKLFGYDTIDEYLEPTEEDLEMISEYKNIKSEIKELEKEAEGIKDKLALKLENKIGFKNSLGTFLTYKQQTQTRFDSKRLEKEHPEIYGKYLKETSFRVLRAK